MNQYWQDLIQQQLSVDVESTFHNFFIPLTELGVIQIDGDDAESFLQNLLTNDVSLLSINQSQLSGLCNAKGRLLAVFLLVRRDSCYHLFLPKNMCGIVQQRLMMYVLRSNVTISDLSEQLFCIGIISNNHIVTNNDDCIIYPNDTVRKVFLCQQHEIETLVDNLRDQGLELAPQSYWNEIDIEQGLPMVWPQSKEKFTPQQLNLDLMGGVSFSKGCYPGQEVVARLHYLGKPSRRLFKAEAQTTKLPDIATEVITENGDIAGHIVSAVQMDYTVKLLVSLKLLNRNDSLLINKTIPITVQDL